MLCDPDATVVRAPPGSGRVAVLVDPSPEDWRAVTRLDARVVLVRSGELEETAVVRAFLYGADAVVPASRPSGADPRGRAGRQRLARDLVGHLGLVRRPAARVLPPRPTRFRIPG
jgi:hypothetical protein